MIYKLIQIALIATLLVIVCPEGLAKKKSRALKEEIRNKHRLIYPQLTYRDMRDIC
jgi:hypothetical protein